MIQKNLLYSDQSLSVIKDAAVLAAIFWGILFVSMLIDRRRMRNCFFLLAALLMTQPLIASMFGRYSAVAALVILILICAVLLAVPIVLISNGIIMLRREGKSFANMLSLLFGLFIGAGEIATICVVFQTNITSGPVMVMISVTVIYFCLIFLSFFLYSLFIQHIPHTRDFDYVIIHGAGLLHGNQVSPLLADRMNKAIQVYQKDKTHPIMIPSGGQGSDETVSEARAMADYLMVHGVDPQDIELEDKSLNTWQNLQNSFAIINSHEGRKRTALVTSNYHVYRCLQYCRQLGFKCTGIGAHTAAYYYPSALIREFAAVMKNKRHLALILLGWLALLIPLILMAVSVIA